MAITTRTVVAGTLTGATLAPFTATNTDGEKFLIPTGATALVLRLINGSGGAVTFTIDDPTSQTPASATAFNPDVTISVPATSNKTVVIRDLARFRSTGGILVTPSAFASVTYEAVGIV